jgi:hypothetical protein
MPRRLLGGCVRGVMCARLDAVRRQLVADVRHDGNVADDRDVSLHVLGRRGVFGRVFSRVDAVQRQPEPDVHLFRRLADDLNLPVRVLWSWPLLRGVRPGRGRMCRHLCRGVFRSGDVGGTLGVSLCLLRRRLLGGVPAGVHAVRRGRCGDMYRERDVGRADGLPLRVLNRCMLGDMHPDRDQVQRQ